VEIQGVQILQEQPVQQEHQVNLILQELLFKVLMVHQVQVLQVPQVQVVLVDYLMFLPLRVQFQVLVDLMAQFLMMRV
jgi:hypothetical protein